MACSGCRRRKKQLPVDRRGNSLDKYAYLNPNQIAIRDAQKKEEEQKQDDGAQDTPKEE